MRPWLLPPQPVPPAKSFDTCLYHKPCQFWSRRLVNFEHLRSMDTMEQFCKGVKNS